ncbi:MAG: o-succinylbenzoate synthase [Ignavibacterium sp.]|nr:o-succinylbenzoate synthase [Ignavibacterium sp.]
MKLDLIELRHIKMKLITPFKTSMGTDHFVEHLIIKITSEGISGWGECVAEANPFYSYETVKTSYHIIKDFIIPNLIGKKIFKVEDAIKIWNQIRGHRMAKAGVEAAIWDLIAKRKNISLSELMGGTRNKIDVGVSIGIQKSEKDLIEKVETYLKEGYKRIKIKIQPGYDIRPVKSIRKYFPSILLQVDANSAYSLNDKNRIKKLDNFNLLLIEQPLGYEDIYQHSKLQKELTTPICLDESIHSLDDATSAVELDSCRVINLKPGRVGGFNEAIKIHNYCMKKKIPVWCGGMLETGIGRAGNIALASLKNFSLPGDISASRRYFEQDIVEPEFVINKDGTMNVPKEKGISVEVNERLLNKFTLYKEIFK